MDWLLPTATAALVVVTGLVAVATFLLARATQTLAQSAVDQAAMLKSEAEATQKLAIAAGEQSATLQLQAEATRDLAKTAAEQLEEFRAETRAAAIPVLRWELVDPKVEMRPTNAQNDEHLIVTHCRLANYGAAAILRPVIEVLENSVSFNGDPRLTTPPTLLPTGASWPVELQLGPVSTRLYPSQRLKVKIDARPTQFSDELRPVICELLFTQRGTGYIVELRSTSGWQT